jgi:hypothetical protein
MTKAKLLTFLAAGLVTLGHTACSGGKAHNVKSPDPHAASSAESSSSSSSSSEAATDQTADLDAICRNNAVAQIGTPKASAHGPNVAAAMFGVLASADRRYSMSDLQALQRKGQHEELLQHIEDVPPSGRGKEWDALLEKSATALLEKYNKDDANSHWGHFALAESFVQRYPQLAEQKKFMTKRASIGKNVIARCFEQSYAGEECLSLARDFIAVQGTDPGVVLAIAKTVRGKQNSDVAVPFFLTALEVGKDSACADEDLALATTAGLALPPDYDRAAGAREIAQNKCFEQLQGPIVDTLKAGDAGSYFTANACTVLRAKGVVK